MASRREILRDLGGVLYAFKWVVQSTLENGFRPTLGNLVSRAAYLRREDPKLYQHWIERVERLPETNGTVPRALDMLLLPAQLTNNWAKCIRSLAEQSWVNQVHVVLSLAEDSDAVDLANVDFQLHDSIRDALIAIKDSSSIGVGVVSVPGLLRQGFGDAVVTNLSNGFDCCLPDHDLISDGKRRSPYFKPGFSRELIFDPAYAPVIAVSQALFISLESGQGDLDSKLIQDLLQLATRPVHLPHVLVHLLEQAGSWKPGTSAQSNPRFVDFSTPHSQFPEIYPQIENELLVSILIPTRDRLDLLRECVESIQRYKYRCKYEIVVMDNQSSDKSTLDWIAEQERDGAIRRIVCDYTFNWSRLNNDGVAQSFGDVVILLNNDTVAIQPDWLDRLVMLVSQKDVAIVGPLLLYPDLTIQHAGVVLGFGGFGDHVYMGESLVDRPEEITVSPLQRRDVTAITGACLVIRREIYQQLGGLNEQLTVAGDLELCLRARKSGFRNLFDPGVRLIHKESKSRQKGLPREDRKVLTAAIARTVESGDPFYNSNLSLRSRSPMPELDEGSAI